MLSRAKNIKVQYNNTFESVKMENTESNLWRQWGGW